MLEEVFLILFNSFIFVWRTILGREGVWKDIGTKSRDSRYIWVNRRWKPGGGIFSNREKFVFGGFEKEGKNSM